MTRKKSTTQPAQKPPVEKKIEHSIKPRPIPKSGGSYVVEGGKLIKQNEG